MAEVKTKKTNTERIKRIYNLCEEHFGDVRFVGIKFHKKIGWIAKVIYSFYAFCVCFFCFYFCHCFSFL